MECRLDVRFKSLSTKGHLPQAPYVDYLQRFGCACLARRRAPFEIDPSLRQKLHCCLKKHAALHFPVMMPQCKQYVINPKPWRKRKGWLINSKTREASITHFEKTFFCPINDVHYQIYTVHWIQIPLRLFNFIYTFSHTRFVSYKLQLTFCSPQVYICTSWSVIVILMVLIIN